MKAYKKIISFILTLVMMLSLSVNVFAAEPLTDDPNMIEWKYTVFADESLQKVVEEGVIPNAYARYTWRGITLKNGEVAILTPSNNSMGLYCNSGRYITINYTLSRSAFHRSRVRAYVAGPSSEFVREITASGLRSGFTTQATDYYYGMVTNLSSDAFTIKSLSQDLIIGYVKDGIMYEGEVFDELSGKYSFSPDEKGEYFFYLLSGSSDYLSLKSGNLEVN